MEIYKIFNNHVVFHKPVQHPDYGYGSVTIPKVLILDCAKEIKETGLQTVGDDCKSLENTSGDVFSNMFLCLNCNNYGFPSTYTLADPGGYHNICTECANRMRYDGLHIVDQEALMIRLRRTVKKHKYSSNKIHAKVIQEEKKVKEKEEKRKWYLRACVVGICPECGGKIEFYNSNSNIPYTYINIEYKCEACSFDSATAFLEKKGKDE